MNSRSKVIHIFKLKQGYSFCSVPLSCKLTHPNCSIRSYSAHDIQIPFCRTASFFNSFLPSSLRLWNSLPISVKSSTSLSFIKFTMTELPLVNYTLSLQSFMCYLCIMISCPFISFCYLYCQKKKLINFI